MSLDQELKDLQKQTTCPAADNRLFIFAQAMDPYNRRYIVLECPAKRKLLSNASEWKVKEEEIKEVCCDPNYAEKCAYYKKARS